MKIAIPIENGCLHGHFGGCREFALVEVDADQKRIVSTEIVPAPEHRPGLFPRWLRERGATTIVAGGIGQRALANFALHGILVRAGVPGTPVEQLAMDCLNGRLTVSPTGCGGHEQHREQHQHHGHGCHHGHDDNGKSCAAQG